MHICIYIYIAAWERSLAFYPDGDAGTAGTSTGQTHICNSVFPMAVTGHCCQQLALTLRPLCKRQLTPCSRRRKTTGANGRPRATTAEQVGRASSRGVIANSTKCIVAHKCLNWRYESKNKCCAHALYNCHGHAANTVCERRLARAPIYLSQYLQPIVDIKGGRSRTLHAWSRCKYGTCLCMRDYGHRVKAATRHRCRLGKARIDAQGIGAISRRRWRAIP